MAGNNCWVAVASAEHVRRGRHEGFMQVCHGKAGPLRRVHPGDRVVYYSPTVHFGGKDRLQAFTALGTVLPGDPYEVDMGDGFRPFRRDVSWDADSVDAPIAPLLGRLSFTAGRRSWGYAFRFGLLLATMEDVELIAAAMLRRARSDVGDAAPA
ncbi:EVE domain-containing protein [Hydrogenophaga sp.]|uniref:EVE domain-containing protein n=1 Tax=Hydrogenophaga sp. TaxID=1904254 RepID=UPI002FC9A16C